MSTLVTFPFTEPTNYTYDPTKIEIVDGIAKLKLQEDQVPYTIDFSADTGFTYNSALAEFVAGKLQQKDIVIPNELCYIAPETTADAKRFQTSGTATAFNGATVTNVNGTDYLDLTGKTNKYFSYPAANAALSQSNRVGTFRCKVIPMYDGFTNTNSAIFTMSAAGNSSKLTLYHQSLTSNMRLLITKIGGSTQSNATFASWAPITGQEYELELTIDVLNGTTELFIDGVSQGTAATTLSREASTIFTIGDPNYNQMFYIRDVQVFDTIQHTASFTSEIPRTIYNYPASEITTPELVHTGIGTILDFTEFETVEANDPRYTIQIGRSGNYLYWDGAAWSVSNGTYAQATAATDFSDNVASLDIDGEIYGQFKIYFADSKNQAYVDTLTATVSEIIGYPTDNPTIAVNSSFRTSNILDIEDTTTITGSDEVKYVFNVSGQNRWVDGASAADSNGTYAESNTLEEMLVDIENIVNTRKSVYPIVFLHSEDGQSTPELDLISITYNAAIGDPTGLILCNFEGVIYDYDGPIANQEVYIRPYVGFINTTVLFMYGWRLLGTTDAFGWFESDIYVQPEGDYWEMKVGTQRYKFQLPNADEANFSTLLSFEVVEV